MAYSRPKFLIVDLPKQLKDIFIEHCPEYTAFNWGVDGGLNEHKIFSTLRKVFYATPILCIHWAGYKPYDEETACTRINVLYANQLHGADDDLKEENVREAAAALEEIIEQYLPAAADYKILEEVYVDGSFDEHGAYFYGCRLETTYIVGDVNTYRTKDFNT